MKEASKRLALFLLIQAAHFLPLNALLSPTSSGMRKIPILGPELPLCQASATVLDPPAAPLSELADSLGLDDVESRYGMPWESSVDPDYTHDELFFMPFWEWQIAFMKQNLSNLRLLPTIDRTNEKRDLTFVENSKKKKRMITLCFESDEYRLIRLTYLDAGTATQVFTSLFYPRTNIPVLGIDFLQFNNQTRHLTVVDMQPIHLSETDHDLEYSHLLEPIRNDYPNLQNSMSKRFYDENQFFSKQMLLGRGEDGPGYVWEELLPAYKSYLAIHVSLVKETLQRADRTDFSEVLRRHKAYDDYSSVRDPAHGLLKAIFGKRYADAFVYDVLFPLSEGVQQHSGTSC